MSSKRTAQSARIPDLSRLSISSQNSAMPVTTRSMRRGDLAQARRQKVVSRQSAPSRVEDNDDDNDDNDNNDDSDNEEDSAARERLQEVRCVQAVSLHFAATVPVAWFTAQCRDNSPQSDQLLRSIGVIGRHSAKNPELLVALEAARTTSVANPSWVDTAMQMLAGKLEQIKVNFPENDVPDTAKALAGWQNAMRAIWMALRAYHAGRVDVKQRFANVLLTAWEFLIGSDFDFNATHAYQPNYTRPDPYGNSLFRRIVEGGEHGVFGLGEIQWALQDAGSREPAPRAAIVCRYIYEHIRQPSEELAAALQEMVKTIRRSP